MVVIQHTRNVARCAWLGELDSAEESDEISSEFDFQQEVLAEEDASVELEVEDNEEISAEDDSDKILLSSHSKEKYY